MFLHVDVADENMVLEAVSQIEEQLGPVQILVNNAAVTSNINRLGDMERQDWDREISVNLTGAFNCIKAVLNGMIELKWGRVINISSMSAVMGAYGRCSYTSSKAGLVGLTKTLALEYARDGITANVILPGLIESPATDALPERIKERAMKRVPGRRFGCPEDVGSCVSFLASEKAKYINGCEMRVSGGLELFTY